MATVHEIELERIILSSKYCAEILKIITHCILYNRFRQHFTIREEKLVEVKNNFENETYFEEEKIFMSKESKESKDIKNENKKSVIYVTSSILKLGYPKIEDFFTRHLISSRILEFQKLIKEKVMMTITHHHSVGKIPEVNATMYLIFYIRTKNQDGIFKSLKNYGLNFGDPWVKTVYEKWILPLKIVRIHGVKKEFLLDKGTEEIKFDLEAEKQRLNETVNGINEMINHTKFNETMIPDHINHLFDLEFVINSDSDSNSNSNYKKLQNAASYIFNLF